MIDHSVQEKLGNQSLGDLVDYDQLGCGIEGNTSQGIFQVSVYGASIFRIRINQHDFDSTPSYAVISEPNGVEFEVAETDTHIDLVTEKAILRVRKFPVRFTLLNKKEEIINEDDLAFGTSWVGEQVTTYKKLQKEEKFIGLGEKTGPLNRKGKGYQNWNTDHFGYGPEADPLYVSIPFYIGVHDKGVYGLFFDNSFKSHFNFGASNNRFSSFSADAGEMDYYLIHDDSVSEIVKAFSELTGKMSMPPMWSLGYQQCRYSYYPDKEVMTVANTFRDKDIPADTIVMDIHYMDKYKIFTWDEKRFPHPDKMIDELKKLGFRVVVMCDPGIKVEEGYQPYEEGVKNEVFIKYPDGENYTGEVWPGWCHFPDFSNPKTRKWWSEQMRYYSKQGITGFWNDMNEIATWGQYLPELMTMDFDGHPQSMRRGRNIYGLQMARSTFNGSLDNNPEERPFNLTRSGFAGIQRYATVWTGDNVANDEHMLLGVRLVNSLGLSGVPVSGYDVGGFVGNANEYLFARWIQLGSFSPFFRGHTMINSRDSEPWAYGEEVEEISRNYVKLRYKLMMYIYHAVREASQTGLPVSRSLAIEYWNQEEVFDPRYQNEYTFGDSILVAPVESYKELVKVYLPEGDWYEMFTDKQHSGGEMVAESPIYRLPLFIKASAIIPVCPEAHSNTENLGDVLEFHIYHGKDINEFEYYEDDGVSYQYKDEKSVHVRKIIFDPNNKSVHFQKSSGDLNSRFNEIRICFHGFERDEFNLNGKKIKADTMPYKWVEPISNFDPLGIEIGSELIIDEVKVIDIDYNNEEIEITWK